VIGVADSDQHEKGVFSLEFPAWDIIAEKQR